jgi:hypothetical protein
MKVLSLFLDGLSSILNLLPRLLDGIFRCVRGFVGRILYLVGASSIVDIVCSPWCVAPACETS